jgi:hypothetical protein
MSRVHYARRTQGGQSSVEYAIVSAVLAFGLGIGLSSEDSALRQLLDAFVLSYRNASFAISLP